MTITTQIELGLLLDVEAEVEGYVPARRNGSGEPGPAGWDAPSGGWVGTPKIVLDQSQIDKIRGLRGASGYGHPITPGEIDAPALVAAILDIITDGGFSTEAEEQLSEKSDEEPYTGPDTREERDGLR